MSTHKQLGHDQSITETRRALRHFTNRRGAIKQFAGYLNSQPAHESILFFHGDGGNGKTLLLRFLRESCCKYLEDENWQYVNSLEGDQFIRNFVGSIGYTPVPATLVDFALEPRGEYRPKEAFSALTKMRKDLSGVGLKFPLYDFACTLYLHKTGRLTPERLTELFPQEEIDFITEAVGIIQELPGLGLAKAALGLFNKHLREKFTLYRKGRGLDEEQVEELRAMDPESDLYGMFPTLFAQDLNTAMTLPGAPQRVALFFDTHEAFWEVSERRFSDEKYFMGDEWLRSLLRNLQLDHGIIVVMAGRESPRWREATRETIPAEYLDDHLLGGLSSVDAEDFLLKFGINNKELSQSLLAYSEIRPNEVHPLFLGLCVDIVLAARNSGGEVSAEEFRQIPGLALKAKELMNRLRKYVDKSTEYAISALSACRSFDRDLYVKLMRGLDLGFSNESFEYVTEFSIVWESTDRRQGWYRIHDLIRRLAEQQQDGTTIEAHRFLAQYYEGLASQGNVASTAEASYHLNRLKPSEGVGMWIDGFRRALELTRYDVCRTLIGIRNELIIKSEFERGLVSSLEGDYYAALSLSANALIEYSEAINSYDIDLSINPDAEAHNNRGLALARLGEVLASLSQHNDAIKSYEQAILACHEALRLAPNMETAQTNQGLALMRLGEVQASLSQHEEAMKSYEQAIRACDASLQLAPDEWMARNNKGVVLLRLGEVQASLSRHEEAIKSYKQAIRVCDAALQLAPEMSMTQNNKGLALMRLGESYAEISQHREGIKSYEQAILAYDEALRLAPDMVAAHSNKAGALLKQGESHAQLSEYEEAINSYENAILACGAALRLAPEMAIAQTNKGLALIRLGEAQGSLDHHEEAIRSYEEALHACYAALRLAPNEVMAHSNKAVALLRLGESHASLSQNENATKSYEQAILACDAALCLAPNMIFAQNNKAVALMNLGELQASQSHHEEAIRTYQRAILVFDAALRLAPKMVMVQNNKGLVFVKMGDSQAELSQDKEATNCYQQALAIFSESFEIAEPPEHIRELRDDLEQMLAT